VHALRYLESGRWSGGGEESFGAQGEPIMKQATTVLKQATQDLEKRQLLKALIALKQGDFSARLPSDWTDIDGKIADTFNEILDLKHHTVRELNRLSRVVGKDGKLSQRAALGAGRGAWADTLNSVNALIDDLVHPTSETARVIGAVAKGDLSQSMALDIEGRLLQGEFRRAALTVNTMVDQLLSFASEVTRVAREVGTEGKLGGQAKVKGVAGTWKDLTDNVNLMASNLTSQVRNIATVTTGVANGDLSKKITVDVHGEFLELKNTVNTMVDQLNFFASEVTRVAREVGTEGKLGGQADVRGAAGTWKDLTVNVNFLAGNLTSQVRNIADVGRAVAAGDLTKKITVDVQGEFLEVKSTMNTMVDQLNFFASEVTRVAREVGTEGKLGGQADVRGAAGTWKDLTDNVNFLAGNITSQVRNIADVGRAVAAGDLTKKITVDVQGEFLEVKSTMNTMVDQLNFFASEVTRVAREVGTEGKLGGQAQVPSAAGTWKDLTDSVNQLAANLTTQVRALADVAKAVTKGDLTRSITVVAQGEVAALKDNINEMIGNLRGTTIKNTEQDWLKTNLAKFARMLQGQKDMLTVGKLILSELAPVVSAQQAVFYILGTTRDESPAALREEPCLRLLAGYAVSNDHDHTYKLGEGLVGQCAVEGKKILLADVPEDYFSISSGLGESRPHNVIVLPVLFEGQVKGVMELASFSPFSQAHEVFLDQLTETIGIVLNTIEANTRTEDLLKQSQSQARELLSQQEELQKTNQQLEEKAGLLANQNAEVERKNQEVEQSRSALEEKAKQLALTSKYKSEFLANMSHELRTPLNSLLILSDQLSRNADGNLHVKQVDYAKTIHASGHDLLSLINDILDLSKIESGTVSVEAGDLRFKDLQNYVERTFTHVAESRKLRFAFTLDDNLPQIMHTDAKRLQQVIKNLLSNAFKFTEHGVVGVRISLVSEGWNTNNESLNHAVDGVLAFAVTDTGIGIPLDKQQIIFEAFQQADGSTSRKYGGTGLGLAISREITHMLGGEMHLTSLPGKGSTFTFFLPVVYSPTKAQRRINYSNLELAQSSDAHHHQTPDVADIPTSGRIVDEITDDRAKITASDTVLLVVDNDRSFVTFLLEIGRSQGFKVIVTSRGGAAIALTRQYRPAAIIMDMRLTDIEGWRVLQSIKNDLSTRHIPVAIISHENDREHALRLGAFNLLTKPVTLDHVDAMLRDMRATSEGKARRLLIVEDNPTQRDHLVALLSGTNIDIKAVGTLHQALAALTDEIFDCVILDLVLPDMAGVPVAEAVHAVLSAHFTPLIILTVKNLNHDEETRLLQLSKSVVMKDYRSPEVLLDEVSLCLHRPHNHLTPAQRKLVDSLHRPEIVLRNRKVLVVDDDIRNIFAMTSLLERFEMKVTSVENGKDAIAALDHDAGIEMVLMDIMMPEMDGYETMRSIRLDQRYQALPIIALTAKAMKGDREKCLDAGASDYISKPVDTDSLLSLLCIWLYQSHALIQEK
jgi:signal transduction histidine kinase/DNA-binding response OmpR family regulator/HAMP domain-containing protein